MPPENAATKPSTHVPTVTASTRIAAVDGCSESEAAAVAGATTPSSGNSASESPAAVPPCPLTSAYDRTALMKVTPTRGPTRASMTHQERDVISSRHSFFRSHVQAPLCEGKEDLLEIRRQA